MALTLHYGVSAFDFNNFDNECTFGSGTSGNYYFKREAETEKYITIRRIRMLYRDLGPAIINLAIQGQNQDNSINTVNINNFAFGGTPPFIIVGDGQIHWCYTNDFEITITIPQLTFVRVSGAISILRFTLIGDGIELPVI